MREILVFLIAGAPVFGQAMGNPIPDAVRSPRPQDLMNFDIGLSVTGRVLLDDHQPPPEPVLVEYSCRGTTTGVVTDVRGKFAIPIGTQQASTTGDVVNRSDIQGCRVQVRIPGYEELIVPVKPPTKVSALTVGDLTLKVTGPQASAVFSASGRNAPPKARAQFVKAFEQLVARKYADALGSIDKAIAADPNYASALQLKGNILEFMVRREDARAAYQQAAAADPAYAKPLVQLAEMAAEDQNAAAAAQWAAKVNALVPAGYPGMYLIEGSSDVMLGRFDDAEKATRAGLDADPKATCPGLRKTMGDILFRRAKYAAALEQFDWYLREAPDARDIPLVQQRADTCKKLVKVEKN